MPAPTRFELLRWGLIVEGGLVVVAGVLAWLVGVDPWLFRPTWPALAWGIGAVAPMLLVYFVSGDIRDRVVRILGPALARCRWTDLVLLAALAGFGEELLFRGTLELLLERGDLWAGMLATNLLFGLAHSLSWQYFVFATSVGVYLSWLSGFPGERNLLPPVIAHALYDFIAFAMLRAEYLHESERSASASGEA